MRRTHVQTLKVKIITYHCLVKEYDMDRYLQAVSHQPQVRKRSVITTLMDKARTISDEMSQAFELHVTFVLKASSYSLLDISTASKSRPA